MRQNAVKKVAFIARPPRDRSELSQIVDLADKLMELGERRRRARAAGTADNIIVFPSEWVG